MESVRRAKLEAVDDDGKRLRASREDIVVAAFTSAEHGLATRRPKRQFTVNIHSVCWIEVIILYVSRCCPFTIIAFVVLHTPAVYAAQTNVRSNSIIVHHRP